MFEPRYREGQRERGLVGVSIRHIYVKIPPTKHVAAILLGVT